MKKIALSVALVLCAFAFFGDWGARFVSDTAFNNPDRGPLPATGILLLSAVLSLAVLKRRAKSPARTRA